MLKNFTLALLLAAVLVTLPNTSFAENPMRVSTEENVVSIQRGPLPRLRYGCRDVPYKPCVQQLSPPDGATALRDSPADHKHHHALMYAVTVDGLNFWEEYKQPGRQKHKSFGDVTVGATGGGACGGFTEILDWVDPETDKLLLNESRTIRACRLDDSEATLVSWRSEFAVPKGKDSATLSGSHYFGLGVRFVKSMDTGAKVRNSSGEAGEVVRGDEHLVRAKWCAITGDADGKPVTIAMFCHPDNLRHPTHWFTMTKSFAYLSATMNLHKEPLKIVSGEPLDLRYGVAVWDGQVDDSRIDRLYRQWIKDN